MSNVIFCWTSLCDVNERRRTGMDRTDAPPWPCLLSSQTFFPDSCYQVPSLSPSSLKCSNTAGARQAPPLPPAGRSACGIRSPQWAACQHCARSHGSSFVHKDLDLISTPHSVAPTASHCWCKGLWGGRAPQKSAACRLFCPCEAPTGRVAGLRVMMGLIPVVMIFISTCYCCW